MDYQPPRKVIEEWLRACSCCKLCNHGPCDGVAAGSMCDNLPCSCDEDDEDYNAQDDDD